MATRITTTSACRLALGVAAAVVLLLAATPAPAGAHANYERSSPAADAVVRAPAQLDIWFTQELFRREGENTITLEGPDGAVETSAPELDATDRTHMSVTILGTLVPGAYTVTWTTLSAIDGDSAEGSFVFTVDPAAPEATAEPAADTPEPEARDEAPAGLADEGSDFPVWTIVAALSVAATIGLSGWALRSASPPEEDAR
jgi:methionine-rich copper-binding protein CopC